MPNIRRALLGIANSRIAKKACARLDESRTPSFIVVTPHLVHLAPLAAENHGSRIQPVFVANGIGGPDIAWLRKLSPSVPVIPLRSSLRTGSESLLDHGVVVELVSRALIGKSFAIQDADCFVTDDRFWSTLELDEKKEYAVGPFERGADGDRPAFPETFLVELNGALLARLRREHGITAEAAARPSKRSREVMKAAGYVEGRYLESRKQYFDTLQQFWIASQSAGYNYRIVKGEGESVHHIGGTSYLHRTLQDLAHWDYWPLNVHYFHLRLLELPECARFRDRFTALFQLHSSSRLLLEAYPEYATGWRRRESDLIIDKTMAQSRYGAGNAD
jgi:hypothetical protein